MGFEAIVLVLGWLSISFIGNIILDPDENQLNRRSAGDPPTIFVSHIDTIDHIAQFEWVQQIYQTLETLFN